MTQKIHEIRVDRYSPEKDAPNAYIVHVLGEWSGLTVWCSEKDLIRTTTTTIEKVQEDKDYAN